MDIRKKNLKQKDRHKVVVGRIIDNSILINIIIRTIAIIIFSIIIAKILPISTIAKKNIQEYNVLKKMAQIDNIAHEQDSMLDEIDYSLGSTYSTGRDRKFHIIDNKYHTTQYRDEKYKAAVELNTLIEEQNIFIHETIGTGNPFSDLAKTKFDTLQKELKALQM